MAESNTRKESVSSTEPRTEIQVESEAVREELGRVLSSSAFQSSERLRNFLQYSVERTIVGCGDLIKEYSVGTEVFGRSPTFDPRLDTIVRTEARKLRARLARYYETEGKDDRVRIEFRKGSYAPVFRPWEPESADAPHQITDLGTVPPEPPREEAALVETLTVLPQPPAGTHQEAIIAWIAAASLVIATVAASTWIVVSSRRPPASASKSPSIVVLPFLNLSDDPNEKNDDFLSDGLTDELIDSLGRVPGLRVVARTSAFQYKNKSADIRSIGRNLSVRSVLEGTVRKSGNHLRITAELDDAESGYRVWSESYDKEFKDALAIQREISRAITYALGVQLSGNRFPDGFQTGAVPVSAAAHQAYLRGRFFWDKLTMNDIKTAISYFEQALSIDPNYAEAYEGLAHCYAQIPVFSGTPPPEVIGKIREAASKALALDESLGEAHVDLAMAADYDFDWDRAEAEFKKGIELNPANAVAHRLYSSHLITIGRVDEAVKEDKQALDLDPVSPFTAQGYARSLYFARRYDEAIEQFRKALALNPNFRLAHWGLGNTYFIHGMYRQGMAELVENQLPDDPSAACRLGYAYAITGKVAEVRKILAELDTAKGSSPRDRDIARVYIGLGDKDRAFEYLRKSVAQKEGYIYLKADPVYDSLRSDPRFTDLVRRMHLM
jgi:TolB-like protein/Tfp pilus assembly protein PilF